MKSLRTKTAIKFGLILGAIEVILGLIISMTVPVDSDSLTPVLFGGLPWIALIVILAMAHYEFNRLNNHYISFEDALLIGLIIIAISFVLVIIFNYFNYTFYLKDKVEAFQESMAREFGPNAGVHNAPAGLFIASSFFSGFIKILIMFLVITMEAQWKIYTKAGKTGWASLIPIYNLVVLLEIVKRPVSWIILLIIPGVNIIFSILIMNQLSKRFGKDEGFTVGLFFLPIIFYPLLGLSKVKYISDTIDS